MATFSKRRSIINLLIDNLKEIDGGVSPFDSSYTFVSNVYNNVVRGIKNFESINDYPFLMAYAGPETYNYNTVGNTEGKLTVLVRGFLKHGERSELATLRDNLLQDIDHVIYKMPTTSHNIHTIHVSSIDTDQGMLDSYAVIEVRITVMYELEAI